MTGREAGFKWYLRFVIVPIIVAGGGVIALANIFIPDVLRPPVFACLLDDAWVTKDGLKLTDDGLRISMTRSHTSGEPQNVSFRLSGPVSNSDRAQKTLSPDAGNPISTFVYRRKTYEVSTSFIENHRSRMTINLKGSSC